MGRKERQEFDIYWERTSRELKNGAFTSKILIEYLERNLETTKTPKLESNKMYISLKQKKRKRDVWEEGNL